MNTDPTFWDFLFDLLGLDDSTTENVEAGAVWNPGG